MKNIVCAILVCMTLQAFSQTATKCSVTSFSMFNTTMYVTHQGDNLCIGMKDGECNFKIYYDKKGRATKAQGAKDEFVYTYDGDLLIKQTRAPLVSEQRVPEETRIFTYKSKVLVRIDVLNAANEMVSYFTFEYPDKQHEVRFKYGAGKLTQKLETSYSAFENPVYFFSAASEPWDLNTRMIALEFKYTRPNSPTPKIITVSRTANADGSTASFKIIESDHKATFEIKYDCSEPTDGTKSPDAPIPAFTYFENELEKTRLNRLKHKIKSQRKYEYIMDRKDDENGPGELRHEEFYNEDGRTTKEVEYWSRGGYTIKLISFDDQGKELQVVMKDQNDKLQMMTRNDYDENGKLIKSTRFNQDGAIAVVEKTSYFPYGHETISYGANNEIITTSRGEYFPVTRTYESSVVLSTGNYMMSEEYSFNEAGVKTGWSTGKRIKGITHAYKFKYDANGNEIEREVYTGAGEVKKRHVYEYDKNNFMVKWSVFDATGVKEMVTKYVYE